MYNRTTIMGRITHDLELKTTSSGRNVCSFGVAVERRFQKQGEEKVTDFFNVVTWGQTAEFVSRYFGKGRMILVDGEMQSRAYTDKNGQNVRTWELLAGQVSFTGEKAEKGTLVAPTQTYTPQTEQTSPENSTQAFSPAVSDDDYPF